MQYTVFKEFTTELVRKRSCLQKIRSYAQPGEMSTQPTVYAQRCECRKKTTMTGGGSKARLPGRGRI